MSIETGKSTNYLEDQRNPELAVISPSDSEADDVIVSDERNHASLIDGIRLSPARREIVAHNDVSAVRRAVKAGRAGRAGGAGEASGEDDLALDMSSPLDVPAFLRRQT